jgi:hypothetical protein
MTGACGNQAVQAERKSNHHQCTIGKLGITRDASGAGFAANPLAQPAPQTRIAPAAICIPEADDAALPAAVPQARKLTPHPLRHAT